MVSNETDTICSVNVRRMSVDQFMVQLIANALYEFHVEYSCLSNDLIDASVLQVCDTLGTYQLSEMFGAVKVSESIVAMKQLPTYAAETYTAIRRRRNPSGISHQKKATNDAFGK